MSGAVPQRTSLQQRQHQYLFLGLRLEFSEAQSHQLVTMPFPVPDPFVWDTSFQVFYFGLDDQHRAIFECLFNCCNDNTAGNMKLLYKVTANHFENEENWMKRARYPYYDSHKGLHEDFLAKLRAYGTPVADADLYFAKDWLVQHIKTIDFKYKQRL